MTGFGAFFRKELVEIVRTWRIWVLPGIVLFFALSGPPLAKVTPELVQAVTGGQTGVVIELPEPSYMDAYAQWVKNLSQIVTFAVLIIFGGLVSAERRTGTAVLVLTKPLSRAAFVLAKVGSAALLLCATTAVGTATTWGVTIVTFGEAPVGILLEVTGAWLAYALVLLSLMTLLSTLLRSQAGAAGLGFGVVFAGAVATIWSPVVSYTPAGLGIAPGAILAGEGFSLVAPLVTGAVVGASCVASAMWVFSRQEL